MKIGVYVAHDDDSILGVGGRIVQHSKNKDNVFVVIFTDGENSHKEILGIENHPSPDEVKVKRKKEIKEALRVLGVRQNNIYFLNLEDGMGNFWKEKEYVYKKVIDITKKESPNVVYFHCCDKHNDHCAVNKVVKKTLEEIKNKIDINLFTVWRDSFKNENRNIQTINIKNELIFKKRALRKMRSQLLKKPYKGWRNQERPILEKHFIKGFLKENETFIKEE